METIGDDESLTISEELRPVFPDPGTSFVVVVCNVTTSLTCVLAIVLIHLVLHHSPKGMGTTKYILLLYVIMALVSDLLFAMVKPILMEPLPVIYSAGWISVCSDNFYAAMGVVTIGSISTFLIFFAAMSFDRILAILLVRRAHQKKFLIVLVTASTWVLNILIYAAVLISVSTDHAIMPRSEINDALKVVRNSQILITSGIPLLGGQLMRASFRSWVFLVAYAGSHALCASMPLFLIACVRFFGKNAPHMSSTVRKVNSMLIRVSLVQLAGILIIIVLPILIVGTLSVSMHVNVRLAQYGMLIGSQFLLFDMVTIIVCMRPYRMAFWRLLSWTKATAHGNLTVHMTARRVTERGSHMILLRISK